MAQRSMRLMLAAIALVALPTACFAAVLGIDVGSQFIKTASVRPGAPFAIVLDEASKRKSPSIVAFDFDQRQFGSSAKSLVTRSPDAAFVWMRRLLGKPFGCEAQQALTDAGFPYTFRKTERNTIALEYKDALYTIEELMAMQLRIVQRNARIEAGMAIKDAVITVPVFYSQVERQAMHDAATIAGLNVIALINDNTAAAIQYGIDRQYNVSETHTACLFNMGSTATSVSIVKYSGYNIKKGLTNQTIGQFEVMANAWDETLGGQAFDLRLADHLATKFQEQVDAAGIKEDIRSVGRVMAKLRDYGLRTKEILSANQEFPVRIEGLYKDLDFYHHIKRSELYEITDDLLSRIVPVVTAALANADLTAADIDAFVLIGGSSRIPRVQELLKEALGRADLDQNLNADEAMAMGASFHAANKSVSFRVRKFGYTDKVQFPIGVRISDATPVEGEPAWTKRASLFSKNQRVATKRHVVVPRENDVIVELQHDDAGNLPQCTTSKICAYKVTGIAEAITKFKDLGTPKAQITFEMGPDGIVRLVAGEVTVDESVEEKVVVKPKKKSKAKKEPKKEEEEKKEGDSTNEGEKKEEEDEKKEEEEKIETRTVIKTHRQVLKVVVVSSGDVSLLDANLMAASEDVLSKLDAKDKWTQDIAASRNRLESHIYETRSRMGDNDVEEVSRESNRKEIVEALNVAEDWIYDDHEEGESPDLYLARLEKLKAMSDDIFMRVVEARERPKAIDAAERAITDSRKAIAQMRDTMTYIPTAAVDSLEETLNTTIAWLQEHNELQAMKSSSENPAFKAAVLTKKAALVKERTQRLMRYPKPPPAPKPKAKKNATSPAADSDAAAKADSDPDSAPATDAATDAPAADNASPDAPDVPADENPSAEDGDVDAGEEDITREEL